ncbi:MAG: hypothetical protein ACOCXO_00015 [Bacteroidota bacterium]
MKRALVFVLVLFSITGFSQSPLQAKLYFKNGMTRTGYANFVGGNVRNNIHFRKDFNSTKVEKIHSDSLKKIVYFNDEEKHVFYYLGVYKGAKKNKSSKPNWVKLEQKGYVSLFATTGYVNAGSMTNYANIKFQDYYLKRKDEHALTYYFTRGGIFPNFHFRNRSKRRFADYPELIKKIENNKYLIDDYKEVVRLYSDWLESKHIKNN